VKHRVYLCGPITHLTYRDATDWRTTAARLLDSDKVETISPLRGKDFLKDTGVLHSGTYDGTFASAKGIVGRDHFDCTRADCLLVNLVGAPRVSIGSCFELAWAFDRKIPVVLIMEKTGNCHEHVFISESYTYRVETLEEAVTLVRCLFNDERKPT
jgi:nucleoside 2-deoxyribosyltransferase